MQDTGIEMGWHDSEDEQWQDSSSLGGQTWCAHAAKYSQSTSKRLTFVVTVETFWSWPLWRIKIEIWVMMTEVTEWQRTTLSVAICGNGWRNCSFISSTSQFWTATFSWSPVVLKASHRLQTANCEKYGRTCWTAAMYPKTCRYAISFCDKIGCLEDTSHQHLPTITATRMDCVVCHACTKRRWIQSAKSVTLGCASQDFSKTVTQRHIVRYWVTTTGYTRTFIMNAEHLLIRYITISVSSTISLAMHHVLTQSCYVSFLHWIYKGKYSWQLWTFCTCGQIYH